ncbi:MAG TPA: hypothetical protein DEB09_01775 [Candidatus Magasanikbacteria bacterium]|nr:hypothetical protein [Candidatus Magasanikbacteria bacterium]
MRITSSVYLAVNIFVVLFGLSCFIWGFYLVKEGYRIKDTFQTATGTIYNVIIKHDYSTEIANTQEYLQIEFPLSNGKKIRFTNDYSQENKKYKIGDNIPVYYNPEKPENAYVADYRFLFVPGGILLFLGGALMIFAGQLIVKFFFRKKTIDKLKQTGIKIQAPFMEAKEDFETTIMEKHPVVIRVEMEDGSSLFSDKIWNFNPEAIKPGHMIDIYFDPINKKDYYIDLEFLQNK